MEYNAEAAMARIEGKIDRLNDRHNYIQQDHVDIKARLNSHSDRLGVLERKSAQEGGMREGVNITTKVIYSVLALGGIGTAAAIVSAIGQLAK